MASLETSHTFLAAIAEQVRANALDDAARQLVVEACLGYFLMNQPPVEVASAVRKVGARLEEIVSRTAQSKINSVLHYIASTKHEYFGVLPEEPVPGSKDQVSRALSAEVRVEGVPALAINLNAHRTMIKLIANLDNYAIISFESGTQRTGGSDGTMTTSYGAINFTKTQVGVTTPYIPASTKYTIIYPSGNYDRSMPQIGSDSTTTENLLQLGKWAGLTPLELPWYCLGVLGFLLAPASHSFREVAAVANINKLAPFLPQYRYCGLLGFELEAQPWFADLLATFRGRGFYGDLPLVCDLLLQKLKQVELVKLVLSFLHLPYVSLPIQKLRDGSANL